jgi:hypothetical protein
MSNTMAASLEDYVFQAHLEAQCTRYQYDFWCFGKLGSRCIQPWHLLSPSSSITRSHFALKLLQSC